MYCQAVARHILLYPSNSTNESWKPPSKKEANIWTAKVDELQKLKEAYLQKIVVLTTPLITLRAKCPAYCKTSKNAKVDKLQKRSNTRLNKGSQFIDYFIKLWNLKTHFFSKQQKTGNY